MANNIIKKKAKKSEAKKAVDIVSISYKIGKNIFTAEVIKKGKSKSPATNTASRDLAAAMHDADISCGPNCRCVNGFKERLVSFGGADIWMRTTERC